jgi:hypothetical protein
LRARQEKMAAMINTIQSKLEQIIRNRVEDVLVSVNQWTQGLDKEFSAKNEKTQVVLRSVMSLDMQTKSPNEEFSTETVDTKHDPTWCSRTLCTIVLIVARRD